MSATVRSVKWRFCTIGCWRCWRRIRRSRRGISSSWWRISTATAPIYRRCLAPPAATAGCRGRSPIAAPASRTRCCRRLSLCSRCPTAASPAKMCWRCWTCRCWRRALTSMKRVCATCASGSTSPGSAGEWMTTTSVSWTCRRPASTPGGSALPACCWATRWTAGRANGSRCCPMTNPAV